MRQVKTFGIVFGAFLVTAVQAALPVPSGTYAGTGQWKGAGGSGGAYSVETTVKELLLTSRYTYEHGGTQDKSTSVKLVPHDEPFFDVADTDGKVVGSGYCYETECAYHMEFEGVVIEETLRFSKGSLEKFGAKKGPGFSVVWKEVLTAH